MVSTRNNPTQQLSQTCLVWEYSQLDQESLEDHQGRASLGHPEDQLGQSCQEVLPNQLHPKCKRQHGLTCIEASNYLLEYAVAAARVSQSEHWSMQSV